jgi:hypothetical protein
MLSGWWLSPTPLKNDGLRQLGKLTFPIYGEKKSCPKPPTSYHIYMVDRSSKNQQKNGMNQVVIPPKKSRG